jgi:two-component system cell cycle sensor histidine kinase/response regulator CckA
MEVPGRFVANCLEAARQFGLSPEPLLAGLPVSRDPLDDPRSRVPWNDVAQLLDRIGAALGTDDRIEEFGGVTVGLSGQWAFLRLVPHVVDPVLLLRIGLRFSAPSIFPHIKHALERRPGGALRLTLSLQEPYRSCAMFFRATVGGIRAMPTVVGYKPPLVVVVSIGPRGAVFDVTPPPNRTLLARVRNAVGALRGDSTLFDEIARQQDSMQDVFRALLRTQSELRQLMERIPEPVVVHRDGVLLWANRAFIGAMKCSSLDELRGTNFVDFVVPPEKDTAAARLATPIHATTTQTFCVRVTDGSLRTLELSESQPVNFEETPARMVTARDVTERDALREQLVLADRMSQLGFLAAGVAHEINNPLAYAMLALDSARRQIAAGDGDAAQKSLGIAREGAERVRGITSDLRMFTRGAKEHAEPVDLSEVLRATADLALANIRTRGRLVMDVRPTPAVFADAGRLGQVFMNLLVNALDALASDDPGAKRIDVRAFTNAEGWAVVEVEDNGCGIPRDVEARIFEPFFTTKGPRSGSGLGLALCRRIVSDLGGRIDLCASGGPGALFRVALPPYGEPLPRSSPATRSGRRLRVLVIDDEPRLATALGAMLEDDHDVDVVTSGQDALSRLEAGADYDAILCDLMMAGVGGMDVHARLRARRPELASRIVFMTGGAFSVSAQRFLGEVKNPCLDKPFTMAEVTGALNEVCGLG